MIYYQLFTTLNVLKTYTRFTLQCKSNLELPNEGFFDN
jgi:hypothetical protein